MYVQPVQIQISLHIHAVGSGCPLFTFKFIKEFLTENLGDPDLTAG
jgi:hypothetical protein